MKPKLLVCFAVVVAILASDQDASAQQISRPSMRARSPYMPAEPTVSPYIGLLNNGAGSTLSNYLTLTRPQLLQQAFNQQETRAMYSLNRDLSQLRTATTQPRDARATGNVATRMNYSHYYPMYAAPGQWRR